MRTPRRSNACKPSSRDSSAERPTVTTPRHEPARPRRLNAALATLIGSTRAQVSTMLVDPVNACGPAPYVKRPRRAIAVHLEALPDSGDALLNGAEAFAMEVAVAA